ncbi:hypothetical protein ANN_01400 [Periplaneta americana]|uniref:Uncharacterized protein n=1 Tax=Periplaneta americana TaxID=6978 RepID=A0ABQ8TUI4_PERAM|nr:hypothetical protein ANN_01400 [Periplaneta americana]
MAGLCEGGNEPSGSLKAIWNLSVGLGHFFLGDHLELCLAILQNLDSICTTKMWTVHHQSRQHEALPLASSNERALAPCPHCGGILQDGLGMLANTVYSASTTITGERPSRKSAFFRYCFALSGQYGKALVFLNRRMRRTRCKARLAQVRTTREIVSGFYNCEMCGLRTSQL